MKTTEVSPHIVKSLARQQLRKLEEQLQEAVQDDRAASIDAIMRAIEHVRAAIAAFEQGHQAAGMMMMNATEAEVADHLS